MSASDIISRNAKNKRKEDGDNYSGASGIMRRNIENKAKNIVINELKFMEEMQKNSQNNVNKRLVYDENGNRKITYLADTSSYLDEVKKDKSDYQKKSDYVSFVLNEYGNKISSEDKKIITDYLNNSGNYYNELEKFAQSDHDYFSQWENEDAYNYWEQTEKEKEKYAAMTNEEIDAEIERLNSVDYKSGRLVTKIIGGVGDVVSELKGDTESDAYKKFQDTISSSDYTTSESALQFLQNERFKRKYEEIDTSPDEVNKLIERYTELERRNEEDTIYNAVSDGLSGVLGGGVSLVVEDKSIDNEMKEIKTKLDSLDTDWENLVAYNRFRRDEEANQYLKDGLRASAEVAPVLTSLSTVILSPGKALGVFGLLDNALDDTDLPINPNSPYFMFNTIVNEPREEVMENYDWVDSNGKDWFDTLYSTGMSTADSLFTTAITGGNSWVGGAVLGMSAASDTAQQVALNGGTKEQSLITGLFAGINEMLWEKISIGNFKALTEKGIRNLFSKKGIKTAIGNILKSAGVNFTEEATTEASNLVVEYLVNGGASSYAQAYEMYRSLGCSSSEARSKARNDMLKQIGEAGFGGALQGLFMGGVGTSIGAGVNTASVNQIAKTVTETDIVALQERARALGVDPSVIDVGSAGPWGGSASAKKVANLISAVQDKQAQTDRQKVIDTAKSYGLNVSLYNTQTETGFNKLKKSVANIEREITARINDQADYIYISALADRIQELGESRGKALYIADSYIRAVDGQSLDQYREASLNSEAAKIAINEFNSSGENTPQWVLDAKEKVEDEYTAVQRRYITPVHSDAVETVNVKNNDNSNDNTTVKSNVERTGNGIDNVPKTQNEAQSTETSAIVNGQSVEVEGIGNIGESGATVVVNGKEVDIKNVTFNNPSTEAAYNFASGMDTTEKAKAALELYNPKFDNGSDYKTAFNEYYNAGLKGIGSFKDVDKYYTFAHSFPESWREAVFNAGRSNKIYKSGVNKLYKTRNLSKTQKSQLKVLDLLGEKYGISFLVFDNLKDSDGALSGLQIAGTNKVAVSLEADGKLYLRTAGHECFHIIEKWNSEAATELTEKVINYLKQTEGYNYTEQVQEYGRRYGVDANTAEGLALIHSEMAADSMFDVFSNEKFIKSLVTENRTLAQKIKDFLTDLISELREMITHFHASEEMNALRKQTAVLEDINASFISALEAATKNMQETLSDKTKNTATKSGVRYSIKKTSKMPYATQIEQIENQQLNGSNSLYIGVPSAQLQSAGFSNNPFAMNQTDYRKSRRRKSKNENYSKHAVKRKFFEQLPQRINEAVMFIDNSNKVTVITDGLMADKKGVPSYIIAGVLKNQPMDDGFVNQVKSVYPLDDFIEQISKAAEAGKLVIINKNKANDLLAPIGIQSSERSRIINLARDSISQYSEKSSETDTKNRRSIKLTQKSQQVLDENPELKNAFQNLQNELGLTKGFVPEGKVIHKYAAQLKKDNPCSMNVAEIESDLREIYSVLSSMSGSEGYEYAADLTLNLAKKMLDSSRVLDDLNAEKKELRQKLTSAVKGRKWYLSPEMRSEIEYHYDSYGNFHKKTFGKGFSFSENSTDYLDSDWSELCAAVPELFDSDTPAVEQPLVILEAFSATEYEYGLFDDYQYDTQAKYIATDIMNNLAAVPEADTLIGKMKSSEYDRIAKLKGENAEKIKDLKKKYAEDIERTSAEEKMHYKLQIKQKIEAEKAAKARKSIETTMVRLSGMLANGTKSRHIPLKLIDTVRELCYSITLNRASQAQLGDNLNKIEALYAALNQGKDDVDGETNNQFLKNAYDEYVHNLIHQLSEQLRHKSIGDMTLEELILVDETVKAVAQRVARGNELHIESRNEGVEETAQAISGELGSAKVKRLYKSDKLNNASDKIDHEKWKFLKPVYAWRMIGSDTFAELMNNIRKGEDTWAVDIAEAREQILSIGEKYHKDTWADDKKELTLASGDKFTFSVQQLMMLYVASQREQYIPHLIGHKRGENVDTVKGGFVFEDAYKVIEDRKGNSKGAKVRAWRKRDAGTHHLTESDLDLFAETLAPEQKAYANEMRDYLAKGLAVKGNEITRKLYDMNKFVEDKYFPIKVAREFLDGNMKEPEVRSVLSTSIMKDLQEDANKPILLRNFDDMWAEHVQQMAMFHSFALPLDDFTRVFNCRSSVGSPASIKSRIETACGRGAVSYIENFIKDVNGGVHASSTPTVMNKALSLFKKGAVFASASVAIQQPSAIARALAVVDTKYFAKTTFTKRDYDELMKYAPIARVKSMGFFDNSIGQSTKEWLLSREYKGLKNKAVALLKDSSFRDDVLSAAPEKMDEITWCHLWNAVKAETADKYNLTGEELLKKSGERFAEVVELTQVYDSVFSKSEYMRSKDTGAKMSMAFMAEPTTALNMLVDAAANVKHGNIKQGGRYVGAFVASVIFNNILKSLVTAARDDDEEKTYIEKYISSVAGGVATDINPLTLLPFVKDVLSIFNGYSIERADMSLVQDLYESVESLFSDTESGSDKFLNLAGALAAFLGVPVKNVVRDIRATYNFAAGIFGFEKENEDGEKVPVQKSIFDTSGEGIKNAIKDEFSEGFLNKVKNFAEETFFGTPEEQLYNAIKQGNYKAYEKLLKEEYEGDSAKVNAAIHSGLINYDERVTKAAEARRDGNSTLHSQCVKGLSADGFSNENIRKAVDKVYNELTDDEEEKTEKAYSLYTYEDLNNAIETGGDVQGIIDDIASAAVLNGKTDEKARENIRNQVTSYWKPLYLEASDYEQEEIKKLLNDTELYSDLDNTLYGWEKDYTTEKYKPLYLEASRTEKERIISELEDTGLYSDAAKTARGWEVAVLKEEYKAATSQTEKERIKAEIWNIGYYKYYSGMINALDKHDGAE